MHLPKVTFFLHENIYIVYTQRVILICFIIIMGIVLKKVNENKEISGDQILYAYKAMRRLQKFYMIRASDMAEGRRNDRIVGDPMDGTYVIFEIYL